MPTFDVTVVGSLNTDLSFFTHNFPNPGETVTGSEMLIGCGGKGANQCFAASMLGGRSILIGKIGEDGFGDMFIHRLKLFGLPIDGITRTASANTGAASIIIETISGANRIIIAPGANMLLSREDIDTAVKLGYFNSRVMMVQFEILPETTLYSLKLAHDMGLVTIMNPAPAPTRSTVSGKRGYLENLPEILKYSDFVCPNEQEAITMAKNSLDRFENLDVNYTQLGYTTNLIPCLIWLTQQGVKWPIITMGDNGAITLINESEMTDALPADTTTVSNMTVSGVKKVLVHLKAPKIEKIIDTSGAGDCFVGSLAYFVARHPKLGVLEQIRRAIWVASQSVRKSGTQLSYLPRSELPESLFNDEIFQWPN